MKTGFGEDDLQRPVEIIDRFHIEQAVRSQPDHRLVHLGQGNSSGGDGMR